MDKNKVLIKNKGVVEQQTYVKDLEKQDDLYYYVFYNSMAINGLFEIYTNPRHFGEKRSIILSKNLNEAVVIAESINKTLRLLAGYYDHIPNIDDFFPIAGQ